MDDAATVASLTDVELVVLPFSTDSDVRKFIHEALHGQVAEVEEMLQENCDPNVFDVRGYTALMYASCTGHVARWGFGRFDICPYWV